MSTHRKADPLPRYRTLTVWVRAMLYGHDDPLVQHMIQRNAYVDMYRQIEVQRA
jgi:hypothetical protein